MVSEREDTGAIERWRPVVGFAGFYEVSDRGNVRSLTRRIRSPRGTRLHRGRRLSLVPDKDGYLRVVLRVNAKYATRKIHRLVCEAFHGLPNALHSQVDHIDGTRSNNAAVNLRWVSHGENMHFRHRPTGAPGERNANARLTADAVREIRGGGHSPKALAERFGVSRYAIYDVLRGRRWQHVS